MARAKPEGLAQHTIHSLQLINQIRDEYYYVTVIHGNYIHILWAIVK